MATEAAATRNDFLNNGRILLSNHSYGFGAGWNLNTNGSWAWRGNATATGPANNSLDPSFGQYNQDAADWDQVCWDAPYYLPFRSAGNERNDTPPPAGTRFTYSFQNTSGTTSTRSTNYNATTHPPGDAGPNAGYDTITPVGNAKNIVTVGATNDAVIQLGNFGKNRWLFAAQISDFSSWGPADDGRIKPDIVANGVSLYSTVNLFPSGQPVTNTYMEISGTSMSSPAACGSAALLHEYFTTRFPGNVMRSSTLKALILHTADDLGSDGPDYVYGWGLMNTERAAETIKKHAAAQLNRRINEATLDQGIPQTLDFYWSEKDEPIRATLCWTDPAGTAVTGLNSRASTLVNDLDIDILAPGGEHHQQFRLDPSNPTNLATNLATTGDNDVDNVRQVLIEDPRPGRYSLTIRNDGALRDREQDFSLVVTGHNVLEPPVFPVAVDASTPYEQNFDDSQPYSRQGWTYASTRAGRTAHTGHSLLMDDASQSGGDSATNTATLHLDLEGQQNVIIEFAWRDYLDFPHSLPAAAIDGIQAGDGLMFSLDGSSWRRIMNLPVHTKNGWNTERVNLDAVMAASGLTPDDYTDNVRVRFFQHGTQSFPGDGIEYDNVRAYIRSPGEFTFGLPSISDHENTGTIPLTIFRVNGTEGPASVHYATSNISATSGSDYDFASATADFADGENAKTISLKITNDFTRETTEKFRLTLDSPTAGATLGTFPHVEVTIIDDDELPELVVGPQDLNPVATYGNDAPTQSLLIRNRGGGTLKFTVSENSSWIKLVGPTTATATDEQPGRATISYQTSDLPPGRYFSSIRISDNDGVVPDEIIGAHLLVGVPGGSVSATFDRVVKTPGSLAGTSTTYPVPLPVPAHRGRVSDVRLQLEGLIHDQVGDLEITLESPVGIPVGLMSDAAEGTAANDINLVFASTGLRLDRSTPLRTNLPYTAADFSPFFEELPNPASDLFLTQIGDFAGVAPDGTWELFIADDRPETDTGIIQSISLEVETAIIEDIFAERFKVPFTPFDLSHTSIIFTPEFTSAFGYTSQQLRLTELPSPISGADIKPAPDGYQRFDIAGPPFLFYGRKIASLFIGENGDIGMDSQPFSPSFGDHALIAPLGIDLDRDGGTILAAELADRIVITYSKLTEVSTGTLVSFQVELFRDNRIRITYGDIAPITAEIGLSRGNSENWSTAYQDLSNAPDLGLEIVAEEITDGINFGIAWTSQPDVLYNILLSNDLDTWKIIDTVPGAPGTATVWSVAGQKKVRTYYQVQRTSLTGHP